MSEFKKVTIYKFMKTKCHKKLNIKLKICITLLKIVIILDLN